jgi:hypothetical protein
MMVKALTQSEFRYWLPSQMGPFQELDIKPTAGEVLAKCKRANFECLI